MKRMIAALALTAATTGAPLHAQDVNIFWGEDASCTAWAKTAGNKQLRAYYEFWIRGFVSGHNFASPSRQVGVGELPGSDALYDYIERYCAQNPKSSFVGAAIALTEQLRKPVAAAKPKASAPKRAPAASKAN